MQIILATPFQDTYFFGLLPGRFLIHIRGKGIIHLGLEFGCLELAVLYPPLAQADEQ